MSAQRRMVRLDPPEAAELLRWASRNGFTTHIVGDVESPHALVLVKFVGSYIDLAHLRGADRTEVARVPRDEHANIWRPTRCVAHFYGPVVPALEALRRLPPPDAESAPRAPYQPPRDGNGEPAPLTVTDAERSLTTIRPPNRTTTTTAAGARG